MWLPGGHGPEAGSTMRLPELAATTCVWRDLSASPEECYGDGLKMIKETWEAAA